MAKDRKIIIRLGGENVEGILTKDKKYYGGWRIDLEDRTTSIGIAVIVDDFGFDGYKKDLEKLDRTTTNTVAENLGEKNPKKKVTFDDIENLTVEVEDFIKSKGYEIFDSFEFRTRVEKVLGEEIRLYFDEA